MTDKELCYNLGIHRSTLYEWRKRGAPSDPGGMALWAQEEEAAKRLYIPSHISPAPMKPSELRALLDACNGSPAALRELARELGRCLRASDERRDPLGVFILETRKRYRMTPRADNNKSGKSTREYMGRKYYEAARSGYMGSFEQW